VSEQPLDLDALRSRIAAAPVAGVGVGVTRGFLEQVEREVRAGRAAIAQLAQARIMGAVIDQLASGARA
jgi:hypothetical protein